MNLPPVEGVVSTVTENSFSVCWARLYYQLMLYFDSVPMIELEKTAAMIMIRIKEQTPPVRVRYYGSERYRK